MTRWKISSWMAVSAILGVAVSGGASFAAGQDSAPLATPPGVTLTPAEPRGERPRNLFALSNRPLAYADSNGMLFYTSDKDVAPGKSACAADCLKAWRPAVAPPGSVAQGAWSTISREDGAKQWALKGKPLYTMSAESKGDQANGNANDPAWHAALFQPTAEMSFPDGIAVPEVGPAKPIGDAGGVTLVDDRGTTLYTFAGDINHDGPLCAAGDCSHHWVPLVAPELANPTGDFSVIVRQDGMRLWAYKRQPLYSFDGDLESGDANGIGVDPRWQPAMLVRYFTPAEAAIGQGPGVGSILMTSGKMTLYRRDIYQPSATGAYGLRHGVVPKPAVGRELGTKACDLECLKVWRPLEAPRDALPSGYWNVVTAVDGTKQWAYKGYALYTYAGDKKPGDMTGYDIYESLVSENPKVVADTRISIDFGYAGALFWTYAYP